MILKDLYRLIASRCGLSETDTSNKTLMLDAANGQMKRLFTNMSLQAERDSDSITTVAGTDTYRLNSKVLRAINFRETDSPCKLDFTSREDFERDYPNPSSSETEVPSMYIPMRKIRVTEQPTSASKVSIVSSSAADITSYYVVVRGLDTTGVVRVERLLLTGATPVVSSVTYDSLLSITKDTTNGNVTATTNSGAVTNIFLEAGEKEREHWEIRLYPIPDDAYTIPYTYQYIPWNLSNPEDVVSIPDIYSEAYLAMVTAQVLAELGDPKATMWRAEAGLMLQEVDDANYLGQDNDMRFGFDEVNYIDME